MASLSTPAVRIDSLPTLVAAGDPVLRGRLGAAFGGDAPTPGTIGTYVEIPAGLDLAEPLVIEYRLDDEAAVPYTLVVAQEGARAVIVERLVGGDGRRVAVTAEVLAGAGADITYVAVQAAGPAARVEARRRSNADADARVAWCLAELGGAESSAELVATLAERGAQGEIAALFFPIGTETVSLRTDVVHPVGPTSSTTIVRNVAAGRGRGRYYGNIRILQAAHGAEATLRDDTLLIGNQARVDAIPALEIAANDVRAYHGATVGAIDEEHLFYVMSRGIDRIAAEKLIALGFFEPALSRFPGAELREELRGLLEAKLAAART